MFVTVSVTDKFGPRSWLAVLKLLFLEQCANFDTTVTRSVAPNHYTNGL